ncbi:MAG TPA: hypothetical protein PKK06_18525 [Phycisphaerae bacterium]|nr:hypothetical protein [Phycisphaerae bacterium]HNU53389.1 hypothetical protein [Verrucomicrobiota bacterium]
MMNRSTSLDGFYCGLLRRLRRKGVPCAITGGLACVEFGVVEHTEDCDLLCAPSAAETLLAALAVARFRGRGCRYRGAFGAPLAKPWLTGGWTSHFSWGESGGANPFLDVFGVPPRVTGSWQRRVRGLYADRRTVAEMKRTRRRKDWDQATALGLQMLKAGHSDGWLHIFDAEVLLSLADSVPCPGRLQARRPVLRLALEQNRWLERAVQTEVEFWSHLDRLRLKIYESRGRDYALAVMKDTRLKGAPLREQHARRLELAEQLLPERPLRGYGLDRLVAQARQATLTGLDPALADFLPDVRLHFAGLMG